MSKTDAEIAFLKSALGVTTGSLAELRSAYFGGFDSVASRERNFLISKGITSGSLDDMRYTYYKGLASGAGLTSVTDFFNQYLAASNSGPTYPTNGQSGTGTGPMTNSKTDTFTGTNGSAPSAANWALYNTTGTSVTIQNGTMQIQPASGAYTFGVGALFIGQNGSGDCDVTFDYNMQSNTATQYPCISVRVTAADLYTGGGGAGVPKTGYSMQLRPGDGAIYVQQGYTAGSNLDTLTGISFPSTTMSMHLIAKGKRLALKWWVKGQAEPSTFQYDNPNILFDQSDGGVMFTAANGGATTQQTISIGNFVYNTPVYTIGADQAAPTTAAAGFKNLWVENFNTTAAAATAPGGSSPMAAAYANSWTPYVSGTGGKYYSESQVSVHDGVMDITLDGAHGAAGVWGPAAQAYHRVGGRFSIRMKAIGGTGNGAATMVWPSNDNWNEGEIDYPEQNYEQSPYVHQHIMNGPSGDNSAENLTVQTGASWRDWHIYTIEWLPGTSLKYYLDGALIGTSTTQIPTTEHRHMIQTDKIGAAGHVYIDWVSYEEVAS